MSRSDEIAEVQRLADRAVWTDLRDWTDEPTELGGWELADPAYVAIEVRS
jgi:hypothetical protein